MLPNHIRSRQQRLSETQSDDLSQSDPRLLSTVLTIVLVLSIVVCHQAGYAAELPSSNEETQDRIYEFDTPNVALEGILSERVFYGPPGFGETPEKDARERVLILRLKQSITAVPTKDAKAKGSSSLGIEKDVRSVQLFIFPIEKKNQARKLIGKTVIAIGALNEAVAPSEHLKVSMSVASLNAK
jgi:hypothetical protein